MNKNATIGSTFSWFFAVIAIFIILLIFLVFSATIGIQRMSLSGEVKDIYGNPTYNYPSFRGIAFLLENSDGFSPMRSKLAEPGINYYPEMLIELFSQKNCFSYYLSVSGQDFFESDKLLFPVRDVISPLTITFAPIEKLFILKGQGLPNGDENKVKFAVRYTCDK